MATRAVPAHARRRSAYTALSLSIILAVNESWSMVRPHQRNPIKTANKRMVLIYFLFMKINPLRKVGETRMLSSAI